MHILLILSPIDCPSSRPVLDARLVTRPSTFCAMNNSNHSDMPSLPCSLFPSHASYEDKHGAIKNPGSLLLVGGNVEGRRACFKEQVICRTAP